MVRYLVLDQYISSKEITLSYSNSGTTFFFESPCTVNLPDTLKTSFFTFANLSGDKINIIPNSEQIKGAGLSDSNGLVMDMGSSLTIASSGDGMWTVVNGFGSIYSE